MCETRMYVGVRLRTHAHVNRLYRVSDNNNNLADTGQRVKSNRLG